MPRSPWTSAARAIPWLVGLVSVAVVTWPAWSSREALGMAEGEAPVHLWSLWTSTVGLFAHGPFLRVAEIGFPDGFREHLMDPVNLVVFAPLFALFGGGSTGAVAGWNGLHLAAGGIAVVGAIRLARLLGRGEPGALAAATFAAGALGGSAALALQSTHGRSELLPAALLPLHLSYLHRYLRGGEGPWVGLAAGLSLGAMALGGWYLCLFLLLSTVPVALIWAPWRQPGHAIRRLALVGLPALGMVGPALLALVRDTPAHLATARRLVPSISQTTSDSFHGLEALFRLPAFHLATPLDPPAYAGLVPMGLAVVGALLRPRRAGPWLLLGIWLSLLAPGAYLILGANPAGRDLEGWLLPPWFIESWFPPLRLISSWARIGCILSVPFVAAGIHGLLAIGARWPRRAVALAIGLSVLHLADTTTWPLPLQRHSFDPRAPAELLALVPHLPEGALVQLPLDLSLGPDPQVHGLSLLWQLQHHRPITALPPDSDRLLQDSWIARAAAQIQYRLQNRRGRHGVALGGTPEDCVGPDAAALATRGHSAIVLDLEGVAGVEIQRLLVAGLGAPDEAGRRFLAWGLKGVEAGETCSLLPLPGKIDPGGA